MQPCLLLTGCCRCASIRGAGLLHLPSGRAPRGSIVPEASSAPTTPVRAAPSATITTRDGTRLAYTLQGTQARGTGIALVHSLAMDRAFWQPVADRLADEMPVLTYDCR